ncbi:hypothetical protein [Bacillus tuaregi]|uniref:hypothetical protein n=1 Tax=Bacillus tuaregi TaxID=1816695 RepID=UPI0008F8ED42|nr:hypothetical protein [Bacillus tuaregi]
MRSYLILGMCTLFIVQYFLDAAWLQYLVVLLSLMAFLGSAGKADRFPRMLGLVMMSVGIALEWSKGTGVAGISEGIFLILPLLSLITLAPLLAIPLKLGGYFEAVSRLLHNLLHHPQKLYAGITGTLFFVSPILNLGSVRIVNEFLEDLELPSEMSAKSYIVGFSTALMWSPYFASVSLVLHYLNVPFKDYFVYGMGISILSLLVGNLFFVLWEKRNPMVCDQASIQPIEKKQRRKLTEMVLFVALLMAACLIIEAVTKWSMIVIVCLISISVPLLMTAVTSKWKQAKPLWTDFRDRAVPLMNNEIMLFMSAGMLAFALKGTSVMNGVSHILKLLAHQSFFLFAIAVLLIVFCLTYIGIHQIAVVGALAMQLNPAELGINSIALAFILLLTWYISTALSPFSGLNLMVSRFSHLSGVQVGLRTNGLYILTVVTIGVAAISFL